MSSRRFWQYLGLSIVILASISFYFFSVSRHINRTAVAADARTLIFVVFEMTTVLLSVLLCISAIMIPRFRKPSFLSILLIASNGYFALLGLMLFLKDHLIRGIAIVGILLINLVLMMGLYMMQKRGSRKAMANN